MFKMSVIRFHTPTRSVVKLTKHHNRGALRYVTLEATPCGVVPGVFEEGRLIQARLWLCFAFFKQGDVEPEVQVREDREDLVAEVLLIGGRMEGRVESVRAPR